jgi:hypothetical protein
MPVTKKTQFGKLPPRYNFVFNPYPDMRISHCPVDNHKIGQRKVPLLIYIAPTHLITLSYTCQYCPVCDLLIAHKEKIEHLLTQLFNRFDPDAIGNEYLILGTVEKKAWREGLQQPKAVAEILSHASDFTEYHKELRATRTGWYKSGQQPPLIEPPPSNEWVKT